MLRRLENVFRGRINYQTECLEPKRLGEVIEKLVNCEDATLEIDEDDDKRTFDEKIDFLREFGNAKFYIIRSIWKDRYFGRNGEKVHFDIYVEDKKIGNSFIVTASYFASERQKSRRSAWIEAGCI